MPKPQLLKNLGYLFLAISIILLLLQKMEPDGAFATIVAQDRIFFWLGVGFWVFGLIMQQQQGKQR